MVLPFWLKRERYVPLPLRVRVSGRAAGGFFRRSCGGGTFAGAAVIGLAAAGVRADTLVGKAAGLVGLAAPRYGAARAVRAAVAAGAAGRRGSRGHARGAGCSRLPHRRSENRPLADGHEVITAFRGRRGGTAGHGPLFGRLGSLRGNGHEGNSRHGKGGKKRQTESVDSFHFFSPDDLRNESAGGIAPQDELKDGAPMRWARLYVRRKREGRGETRSETAARAGRAYPQGA